jgi:hypothetical protein
MNVSKENYEVYFLDYFENRLQPEQVAELMVFLEENPELKEEFEAFENITLQPDEKLSFESKNRLKKSEYHHAGQINAWNYEEKMVAYLEGDMEQKEAEELKSFLALNPKANLELNLFRQTFLQKEQIGFPDKRALKKGGILIVFRKQFIYAASAAAVLLLFISLYTLLHTQSGNPESDQGEIAKLPVIMPESVQPERPVPVMVPLIQSEKLVAGHDEIPEKEIRERTSVAGLNHLRPNELAVILEVKPTSYAEIDQTAVYSDVFIAGNYESAPAKQPSFAARFISGLAGKIIGDPNPEKKSFIELTVDGYNMLADREVEVEKEIDASGKVVGYNVKGETIAFTKKVNKPGIE